MEEKKNILIVEDEKNIRSLLRMILEEDNYNVIEAENGKNALEIAKLQDFDMIFTDVRMPVMDGLTFLASLKKIKPDIPVALLTSFDSAKYATEALKSGAFTFCTKPININEVKRVARKGIELRRLSEDISVIRQHMMKSISFKFPSDKKFINGVLAETGKMMRESAVNEDILSMVRNALDAAVTNAIIHGNKENAEKFVSVLFEVHPDSIHARIEDEGDGFDHKSKMKIDESMVLSEKSGKGLFIISCNMDSIFFNDKGNSLDISKRLFASNSGS
jgi:CheY-like chemotaxis protein